MTFPPIRYFELGSLITETLPTRSTSISIWGALSLISERIRMPSLALRQYRDASIIWVSSYWAKLRLSSISFVVIPKSPRDSMISFSILSLFST